MKPGRGTVAGLGGAAATFAFAVGAVSLTRIAGDSLGFPPGLEWTLTAAVDVAGIAGGVMWTGFVGRVRKIGRPMNIVCTTVSGMGVGLDHATHAAAGWWWVAFAIGMFIPALVAWILHALAVMADQTETQHREGGREAVTRTVTRREATPRSPDREAETVAVETASALVATTGTPHREAITTGGETGRATTPLPRMHLVNARPAWASDELINEVIDAIRSTEGGRRNYGVPKIVEHHALPDGGRIGSHRAGALLAHVDELMEVAA